MLNPLIDKSILSIKKLKELDLSGEALVVLLKAVIERGVSFRYCAKGFSMIPFIQNGDIVTIVPLKEYAPSLGDVVAFAPPLSGKLAVHRIIKRKRGFYLLKGDNNLVADGWIPYKKILGCVGRVERDGKTVR